jgi:hypothetical protein
MGPLDDTPDLHLLESVPPVSDPVPPVDVEPEGEEVLNALELRFVELIAAGTSYEDTGAQIGRSPRTCRRWSKRPEIAAAVKTRASEQVCGARAILTSGMSRAARSLVAMSDGASDATSPKVAASRAVISEATNLTAVEELTQRLERLEAQLTNDGGKPRWT